MNLTGKNSLTVFLSVSKKADLKMFFCPYTQSNVAQYMGEVEIIYPGYDAEQIPNVIIRPQKLSRNIHYVFTNTKDKESAFTSFWIQERTFENANVSTYFCFNCQAPQLYFGGNKAVHYASKKQLNQGEEYKCTNPACNHHFRYLGNVEVGMPTINDNLSYNNSMVI